MAIVLPFLEGPRIVSGIQELRAMRAWREVPAYLLDVRLVDPPPASETFRVVAT